jgi:Domain of unknown function (DUF927)
MANDSVERIPTCTVPGYEALPEDGLLFKSNGEERAEKPCLKLALELLFRLRIDGEIAHLGIRVTTPGHEETELVLPMTAATGSRLADKLLEEGVAVTNREASTVSEWLVRASRAAYAKTFDVLSRPDLGGNPLQVPGVNGVKVAPGVHRYGAADPTDEEDAWAAWAWIWQLGAANPKLGLQLGASVVSAYLKQLRRDGFVIDVNGDSWKGKTKSNEIASWVWGDPLSPALRGSWDSTVNGILGRLKETGGLPYHLDESNRLTEHNASAFVRGIVHAVSGSTSRQRAKRDGSPADVETYRLVLFSDGEQALVSAVGQSGAYRRAIELEAPTIADEEAAKHAHHLARRFYGHPAKWIVNMEPPTMPLPEIDLTGRSDFLERLAEPLALCKLGYDLMAEKFGREWRLDLTPVLDELDASLEDAPISKRLHDALWSDFLSNDSNYREDTGMFVEMYGRDLGDGTWAVRPERAEFVAKRELSIHDVVPAMRELKAQGLLVVPTEDKKKRLKKLVRLRKGENGMRCYVLKKPVTDEWQQDVVTDTEAEAA